MPRRTSSVMDDVIMSGGASPDRRSVNTQARNPSEHDGGFSLSQQRLQTKKVSMGNQETILYSDGDHDENTPLNASSLHNNNNTDADSKRHISIMVARATQEEADDDYYKPCHKKKSTKVLIICALSVVAVISCIITIIVVDAHYNDRGKNKKPHGDGCPYARFGNEVGSAFGVPAFSNCDSDLTSYDANFMDANITNPRNASETVLNVYTGMKWQCVEYARRFLLMAPSFGFGYTFASVDGAADIWNLTTVENVWNSSDTLPLERFPNDGNSLSEPQLGDLLIYPVQPGGFPFGHVGVVAYINYSYIGIAEQNWFNAPWPANNYDHKDQTGNHFARVLKRATEVIIEDDSYQISGWMRVAKSP